MTVTFFEHENGHAKYTTSVTMPCVPNVGELVMLSSGWWRVASRRWRIATGYVEAMVTVVRADPNLSDV